VKNELKRAVERVSLTLDVNGERSQVLVPVHKTLLEVLREDMGLTGTKHGCELGECGTCTVLIDGRPELSCLVLPVQIEGRAITTVEGLAAGSELHPLQQAFAELGAAQCGYCTPGILLASRALLDVNARFQVTNTFQSKASNSPFIGETLQGRVVATIVGGMVQYDLRARAPLPAGKPRKRKR